MPPAATLPRQILVGKMIRAAYLEYGSADNCVDGYLELTFTDGSIVMIRAIPCHGMVAELSVVCVQSI